MNKRQHLYLGCFLNRIAITYHCHPLKASPLQILKDFFTYAPPAYHLKAFDEFCLAALHDSYCWHRGSPGNALYYSEQLELLIEAAYLLYWKPHRYKVRFKEHAAFLHTFFSYASPGEWKKRHHAFTSAAISKSSVADELAAAVIYEHTAYLKKLVTVAAVIASGF
ncbi:hypothetical protein [Niabella aquatica]